MKNLLYAVSLVKMDLDDYASNRDQKYIQYAILGFRDLELYSTPSVKVAYLKMTDALTADLPIDYEYYTKIGMCINGQVWTLSLNRNLCLSQRLSTCGLPTTDLSTVDLTTVPNECDGFSFAPHYRGGQLVGEMFSVGGGYNELGYFRIDKRMHAIQFASVMPKAEIVMEYVSTGAENEFTVIPASAVEPIRAYIHWQLAEHDRTVGDGTKERKRNIYRTEHQKARDLELTITADEYLDYTYGSYNSAVKR